MAFSVRFSIANHRKSLGHRPVDTRLRVPGTPGWCPGHFLKFIWRMWHRSVSRHGLLDTAQPRREPLNSVQLMMAGGCCGGALPDTVCWTRLRNTRLRGHISESPLVYPYPKNTRNSDHGLSFPSPETQTMVWGSPLPSKYRVWGGLSFGPSFSRTMVWVSSREGRNTGVGVDEWALN